MNLKRITLDDTVEETVNKINENSTDIEENVSRLEADFISYKDNITLKTSKIEKELNDYKATMQQVNINQEPKQKVSGYGTVPLPKNAANGQVSGVKLKGQTATNMIKNGDFKDGAEKWFFHSSTYSFSNEIFNLIGDGNAPGVTMHQTTGIKCVENKQVFIRAIVKPKNEDIIEVRLQIRGSDNGNLNAYVLNSYTVNELYTLRGIVRINSKLAGNIRPAIVCVYPDAETANGKEIEVHEIFALDLTALGLEDKTADEINEMFPHYFEDTKSTISAGRFRAVGKNIWGGRKAAEDIVRIINNPQLAYLTTVDGRNVLALVGHSALNDKLLFSKFKPNTQYVIKVEGRRADDTGTGAHLYIRHTDGTTVYLVNHTSSWVKMRITTAQGKTVQGLYSITANPQKTYYFDYDTLQIEEGTTETPYEPYKESNAYVITTDKDTGKILELRSLPNGVKDEIRLSEGKLIKRVSENLTFDGDENWAMNNGLTQPNTLVFQLPISGVNNYASGLSNLFTVYDRTLAGVDYEGIYFFDGTIRIRINKSRLTTQDVAGFKAWLQGNPVTLTYQLAEPIEIPVQVSGTLTSYPNGTIYIERILPDAGVYTDKITILHQDAPIKAIEKLSKVDFMTGVETELDISKAEISEDKLSFTHPELNAGDIVFFEYEYDVESTDGEAEVEFYDSRYVVKDTETGKFYKWNIVVANGTPTIEVVEV